MTPGGKRLDLSAIKEDIRQGLSSSGKTARGASIEAGLGASTIRNILEGRSVAPRIDTLTAIAQTLGISPKWLGSSGSPPAEHVESSTSSAFIAALPNLSSGSRILYIDPDDVPNDVGNGLINIYVPMLKVFLADAPIAPADPNRIFALRIPSKDFEPAYYLDDIIFIDPFLAVKPGYDYLFLIKKVENEFGGIDESYLLGRLLKVDEDCYHVEDFGAGRRAVSLKRKLVEPIPIAGRDFRRA